MVQTIDANARTPSWLESLTDHGQRLVLVRDRNRHTTRVSDNVERLTGWSADEFARRLYSLVHPDDQQILFDASRALRNEGATERRVGVRLHAPDGSLLLFDMHLRNHVDDPDVAGLVAVLAPVSRTDPTAEAGRWASLLASSSELVVIQQADGSTGFVSPSVERVLGITADQLVQSFMEIVDVDGLVDFRAARLHALATERGEARTRLRVLCADEVVRDFDVTFANHIGDGMIDGLLIRARDITELVATERRLDRTEARFEALVANSPGTSVLVADDGEVLFTSAGLERLLGYRPEDVVGTKLLDHVHPDDLARSNAEFARLLTHGGTPDQTVRVRRADGGWEWIEISATNRLHDPSLQALVLTLHEVTERVHADHRMQRLLRDSSGASLVIDRDGRVVWTTPGIERFIGDHRHLTDEVVGELFEAHDGDVVEAFLRVLDGPPNVSARVIGRVAPGDAKRWVDVTLTNALDDATINGVIVNIRDVDEAVRAAETGHRLTEVLESTTDHVCVLDRELNLIWANAAATAVFGPAPIRAEALAASLPAWVGDITRDVVVPALAADGGWSGELALVDLLGREIPVEVTVLTHRSATGVEFVSAISRDISERKRMEEQLQAKARHDPLTGLPNREFLSERLEALLAGGDAVGLLFIDLDQFKAVNDSQGHGAGDQLLIAAAERLLDGLRPSDVVARFGGDEFIVVLPGVADADLALSLGERLLDRLRGPVRIGDIDVYLTASAGVALSDGSDASTLISNADAAMYKAKAAGRDRIAAFSSELRARTVERLETAHQLRTAIDRGEIDVWFQPIVDTHTELPVALEALARWSHPDLGVVPPAHFVQVAEETGLIRALGAAVIHRTCEAIHELGDHFAPYSFSVNLSAHQLADEALIDVLGDALERNQVAPHQLHCEVTESAVMRDLTGSVRTLDQIRELGIGIAIDDFGTGHSSLAYLHRLPVDLLKIDREFVAGLSFDMEWDRSLAAGIISLGHSLGLTVVAEGVETAEQSDILGMLGCDGLQGFLFARPTPLVDLPARLERMAVDLRRRRTS